MELDELNEVEKFEVARPVYDPYALIANSLLQTEEEAPEEGAAPASEEEPVITEDKPSRDELVVGEEIDFFTKINVGENWAPTNVSADELPKWYETKYKELLQSVAGEDFKKTVLTLLQDDLLKEVENVEDFKRHYVNFQKNPALYAAQYFPDSLAKIGIEPVLSKEQIYQAVEQEMTKEFGDNYQRLIDPAEAFKLGTYSYSILEKQREYLNQISAKNEENKIKYNEMMSSNLGQNNQPEPVDEKTLEDFAKTEFAKFQRKFGAEQDFVNFVKESYSKNWVPSTEELWVLKNLDKILEDEYKKGMVDGNKKQANEIRKQYGIETPKPTTKTSSNQQDSDSIKVHRSVFDPYAVINKSILGE